MQTDRGFDRLVNFTDAVVAIALTLLVLPLVDIPGRLQPGETIGALWTDHQQQFLTFLLSFVVIAKLWRAHHRIFERFHVYDGPTVSLDMVWLLTIVVLPFTTELVNGPAAQNGGVPVYLANLLVSSATLALLERHGRTLQPLREAASDGPPVRHPSWTTPAIIAAALAVSVWADTAGLWVLLLFVGDGIFERHRQRRSH